MNSSNGFIKHLSGNDNIHCGSNSWSDVVVLTEEIVKSEIAKANETFEKMTSLDHFYYDSSLLRRSRK